ASAVLSPLRADWVINIFVGVFLSAANGVGNAFLGEAVFRSASQFFIGRRLGARSLCVCFTLFHEARHLRTSELLVAGLNFTRSRIGAAASHHQCCRQNKRFHRSLPF